MQDQLLSKMHFTLPSYAIFLLNIYKNNIKQAGSWELQKDQKHPETTTLFM